MYNLLKKEIIDRTNKFLKEIDSDLECYMNPDFEYLPETSKIGITLICGTDNELDYCDFLRKHFDLDEINGKVSWFVWNTLHEVGHYFTLDNHEGKWYEFQEWLIEKISNIENRRIRNMLYFAIPLEYDATKWGIKYLLANKSKCIKLQNDIDKIVRKYISINKNNNVK